MNVVGEDKGQPAEAYVVQGAFVVVLSCLFACAAICWIMLCCKRKTRPMSSKELAFPEEEEEAQLAAGD